MSEQDIQEKEETRLWENRVPLEGGKMDQSPAEKPSGSGVAQALPDGYGASGTDHSPQKEYCCPWLSGGEDEV